MGYSTPLKTSVLRIPDHVHPFRPEKTLGGFSGSGQESLATGNILSRNRDMGGRINHDFGMIRQQYLNNFFTLLNKF
jgi:hypothetical protein